MKSDVWENLISLNNHATHEFETLAPASHWRASAPQYSTWNEAIPDLESAIEGDQAPLPVTADREGYYGANHFGYWASGLRDVHNLLAACQRHNVDVKKYFDFGCASGRVIRHFSYLRPDIVTLGCDINARHVDWVMQNLSADLVVFQNHSIPSLPIEDADLDLISAFSVFTHIETFATTWLMEMKRVLRPGGIAWVTIHSEKTFEEFDETWPLHKALKNHPDYVKLGGSRVLPHDRSVFRWHSDRSYSSNVFYTLDYIKKQWNRYFEILEIRRREPVFQDVVILQKR